MAANRDEHDKQKSGTDQPWRDPNQTAQDPARQQPTKPDLERWQDSNTH
jgi:hypothetical protein